MKTEIVYFDNIKKEITFYIGKDCKDNFAIIDNATPNDIWFHAKDESSCHVIAEIPEEMLENKQDKKVWLTICKKGADLCKQNTNKLKQKTNVEIIYTFIKNVKKTTTIGCVTVENEKKIVV
jgi:predicted ribosome quality control (RQC) complex YloA/Tae2 family protein